MDQVSRKAILLVNDGSTTLEQARSSFNVSMEAFKARLWNESIFVWNEFNFGAVRIHGRDYLLNIFIEKLHRHYAVDSTIPFKEVLSMIERDLLLSPGCCKLSYKHPLHGNILVKTDRDWHFAVEFSRVSHFYLHLDLKIFPSADDGAADKDDSYEDWKDAYVLINLRRTTIEIGQVSDPVLFTNDAILSPNNILKQNPMGQVSFPLPLTREAILSLNNGSTTFEHARSLFNVNMKAFKARLLNESIFVWNEFNFGTLRIHGGDYLLNIFIEKLHRRYTVDSTCPFKEVLSMIERDLLLSPGCCKLSYKHPLHGKILVKTDRDWHFAVEFSRVYYFYMHLDLKIFPAGQTADDGAADKDDSDEDVADEEFLPI